MQRNSSYSRKAQCTLPMSISSTHTPPTNAMSITSPNVLTSLTLPMFITPPPNAHYITLPLQYPFNHHLQRTNAHHIIPPPNAIIYRTSQFHHPTLSIPSHHPTLSMPITSPHQCPLHHSTSNTITLPHFPIDARYDTPLLVPIPSPHCLLHHLPMLITSLHPPNAITSPYLLMPLHHYTLPVPYYITTPINAHYITPPQWPLHRFPIPLHVHHPPSQCPLHHPILPMPITSLHPRNAHYIIHLPPHLPMPFHKNLPMPPTHSMSITPPKHNAANINVIKQREFLKIGLALYMYMYM